MNKQTQAASILSIEAALSRFDTTLSGLTDIQVTQRLNQYGRNQFLLQSIHWYHILFRQFTSPFIYILVVAGLLSLFLGETIDAFFITLFITINALLGFYQENKSEQTLKLLTSYIAATTGVVRNGKRAEIEVTDIVPGDILLLEPGDRIPADVRFIEATNLSVDEEVLSGESLPRAKQSAQLPLEYTHIYEAANIGFAGTTILTGNAQAVVLSTGRDTYFAHISQLATESKKKSTFEKEIGKFSRFTISLTSIAILALFVVDLFLNSFTDVVEIILFSIALAVSVIPEALPVVTTFSLSLGAMRLSKKQVIVKRLSAMEDLGSIQILCTDKTGTITKNEMSVTDIYGKNSTRIRLLAYIASYVTSTARNLGNSAFSNALAKTLSQNDLLQVPEYRALDVIPFDPIRRRISVLVSRRSSVLMIVQGAPEEVMSRCRVDTRKRKELESWIESKSKEGKRILAVSVKKMRATVRKLPGDESGMQLYGLISFEDPIKTSTIPAISKAKALGVQVKILTGDHPQVAGAIAQQIGLILPDDQVITGDGFSALSDNQKYDVVRSHHVFARIAPEQKHEIVRLLQRDAEVGFLGEGINDAPALKVANVAIAVNTAADIAKEVSDIVLTEKSLKVIIDGISEGRAIFVNINKYITATLAENFGNFFALGISTFFIPYLPMLPLQLLLVNLLSDFPMITIATDNVDPEETVKPRQYNMKSFAKFSITMGVISTFFDFMFFWTFVSQGETILQTTWFIGSILTELVFIYSIRTRKPFWKAHRPSKSIMVFTLCAATLTVLIPIFPLGRTVFNFGVITSRHIGIIFAITGAYFLASETMKLLYYHYIERTS